VFSIWWTLRESRLFQRHFGTAMKSFGFGVKQPVPVPHLPLTRSVTSSREFSFLNISLYIYKALIITMVSTSDLLED
jgi:hypothetical protein